MNFQQTHPMASFKNLVERGPGVGIKFSVNLLIHRQGGQIMSCGGGMMYAAVSQNTVVQHARYLQKVTMVWGR